jgi:hypothetical protein
MRRQLQGQPDHVADSGLQLGPLGLGPILWILMPSGWIFVPEKGGVGRVSRVLTLL